jgi:phosphoglycolate phosphatase
VSGHLGELFVKVCEVIIADRRIQAVLFDFDGTLADTAADLGNAMNSVLHAHGRVPLPLSTLRPHTSQGARGMIKASFGYGVDHADYAALKNEFLAVYEKTLLAHTRLFDGMQDVLDLLSAKHIAWGIITNKHSRFSIPIMQGLALGEQVLVCGDTTAHAKPHPEPLLYAAAKLGVAPECCAYVGDAGTDMQAAQAAGMLAIAAAWGFIPPGDSVDSWPFDLCCATPTELGTLLTSLKSNSLP